MAASLFGFEDLDRPVKRFRATSLTLLCLCLYLSTGCGAEQVARSTGTERDSAGIRIVETDPEAWPPEQVFQVSDSPAVSIGVVRGDPDYELFEVQGIVGRPDGGTVVAEFGARLRYYDAEGVHVRTIDLKGEGPGEASAFHTVTRYRGDSLLMTTGRMVSDRSLTEMMVLDSDGAYGRDVMAWFPGSQERREGVAWSIIFGDPSQPALEDGSFLVRGSTRIDLSGTSGDLIPGRAAIMRMDPEGARLDTVVTIQNAHYEYRPLTERKWELVLGGYEAPTPRAYGLATYVASGDAVRVDVYEANAPSVLASPAASTRWTRSYRVRVPAAPATAAWRDAYIDQVVELFRGDEDAASQNEYRERLRSLRLPEHIPLVQDLRVDARGNLWLELYELPGWDSRAYARRNGADVEAGPSRWVVLDSEGGLLGSVLLPEGLTVFEIGADYVLGLLTDALGVQYVRRHSISRDEGLGGHAALHGFSHSSPPAGETRSPASRAS